MSDWKRQVIALLVVGAIGGAQAYLFRSAKPNAKQVGSRFSVEYGTPFKAFAIFSILCFLAICILAYFTSEKERWVALLAVMLFFCTTLAAVLEFFFVRVLYDEDNIYCFSPWRRNRVIVWGEIESCQFSQLMQWWVLKTKNKGKVRLHVFISGKEDLFAELQKRNIEVSIPQSKK